MWEPGNELGYVLGQRRDTPDNEKWSGRWESNPRLKLGKLGYYHYTTPAVASILVAFRKIRQQLPLRMPSARSLGAVEGRGPRFTPTAASPRASDRTEPLSASRNVRARLTS